MKITNSEAFILENQLRTVIEELRESKAKSLTLNISAKRNLQKISELCGEFRKEIQEFIPEKLKELNAKEELTEKETEEKDSLNAEANVEINKFLQESFEYEPFNCGVRLDALGEMELTFDSCNILDLLFSDKKD